MTSRSKLGIVFATGFVLGSLFAASIVSWKWNRDFGNWHATGVGGQAFTAREIYAGRSEELAKRILDSLPGYLADMDRLGPDTVSIRSVVGLVGSAYSESGEPMPDDVTEILGRWETESH